MTLSWFDLIVQWWMACAKVEPKEEEICIFNTPFNKTATAQWPLSLSLYLSAILHNIQSIKNRWKRGLCVVACVSQSVKSRIKWFEKFNYKVTINVQLPWPNRSFCRYYQKQPPLFFLWNRKIHSINGQQTYKVEHSVSKHFVELQKCCCWSIVAVPHSQ